MHLKPPCRACSPNMQPSLTTPADLQAQIHSFYTFSVLWRPTHASTASTPLRLPKLFVAWMPRANRSLRFLTRGTKSMPPLFRPFRAAIHSFHGLAKWTIRCRTWIRRSTQMIVSQTLVAVTTVRRTRKNELSRPKTIRSVSLFRAFPTRRSYGRGIEVLLFFTLCRVLTQDQLHFSFCISTRGKVLAYFRACMVFRRIEQVLHLSSSPAFFLRQNFLLQNHVTPNFAEKRIRLKWISVLEFVAARLLVLFGMVAAPDHGSTHPFLAWAFSQCRKRSENGRGLKLGESASPSCVACCWVSASSSCSA